MANVETNADQPKGKNPRITKIIFAVLLLLILVSIGHFIWKSKQDNKLISDPSIFIQMRDNKPLPEAKLKIATPQGVKTITTDDFKGRWHLVYFGYTYCPDVCPTELSILHKVNQDLKTELKADKLPTVVFISVDPERDTPEKAMEYVKYFDPDFIGLTGDEGELRVMAMPFGVDWHKERNTAIQAEMNDKNYLVSHSTTILLVDPKGRVRGMFPAPHDAQKMKQVIKAIIEHS
jgi:protein SCO1/2